MKQELSGKLEVTYPPLTREAYKELSRKWSMLIIKAIFLGHTRFNEFLKFYENEGLSNKMLATELQRLEKYGYIHKEIVSKTPLRVEYSLTEMGRGTNKIIYERLMFGMRFGLYDPNTPPFKDVDLKQLLGIE